MKACPCTSFVPVRSNGYQPRCCRIFSRACSLSTVRCYWRNQPLEWRTSEVVFTRTSSVWQTRWLCADEPVVTAVLRMLVTTHVSCSVKLKSAAATKVNMSWIFHLQCVWLCTERVDVLADSYFRGNQIRISTRTSTILRFCRDFHASVRTDAVVILRLDWHQFLLHSSHHSSCLITYSMEQSPSWEANWFCS